METAKTIQAILLVIQYLVILLLIFYLKMGLKEKSDKGFVMFIPELAFIGFMTVVFVLSWITAFFFQG